MGALQPVEVGPIQRAGQGGMKGDGPYGCGLGITATGLRAVPSRNRAISPFPVPVLPRGTCGQLCRLPALPGRGQQAATCQDLAPKTPPCQALGTGWVVALWGCPAVPKGNGIHREVDTVPVPAGPSGAGGWKRAQTAPARALPSLSQVCPIRPLPPPGLSLTSRPAARSAAPPGRWQRLCGLRPALGSRVMPRCAPGAGLGPQAPRTGAAAGTARFRGTQPASRCRSLLQPNPPAPIPAPSCPFPGMTLPPTAPGPAPQPGSALLWGLHPPCSPPHAPSLTFPVKVRLPRCIDIEEPSPTPKAAQLRGMFQVLRCIGLYQLLLPLATLRGDTHHGPERGREQVLPDWWKQAKMSMFMGGQGRAGAGWVKCWEYRSLP